MTQPECRALLAGTSVARLACARNNQPYVVPIHFDLDGDFLYGYASLGQKIEWMRQNPLVCLEIDELRTHGRWKSVVVFGYYEELPDTPEHERSRKVAERLFQRHPMWWEPASVPLAAHERRPPVVFRIRISKVTGRRATGEATHVGVDQLEVRRPAWLTQVLRVLCGGSRGSSDSTCQVSHKPGQR